MTLAIAVFLAALAADTVTFLLLPPGGEANPLVISLGPAAAIALRWSAAAVLLLALRWLSPARREAVLLVGIVVASVGAGSNLAVLV